MNSSTCASSYFSAVASSSAMTTSSAVAALAISISVGSVGVLLVTIAFRGGSLKGHDEPETPPGQKPIPSPRDKHWLLGHGHIMPKMGEDGAEHHDDFNLRMALKYQTRSICFYLPIFGRSITIGDPELARIITTKKDMPKFLPLYGPSCYLFGPKSMLITVDHAQWQKKRRTFNPGFAPDFLKSVIEVFCQKAIRFLDNCESDARKASFDGDKSEKGGITNMHQRAMAYTSDVIAQVAFGEDWGHDCDAVEGESDRSSSLWKLQELIEVIEKIRGYLNSGNLLMYIFDWKAWRKERQLEQSLDKDFRNVVTRRINALRDKSQDETDKNDVTINTGQRSKTSKDILSLCLRQIQKDRNTSVKRNQDLADDALSEEEMSDIVDQLKTFYFAGHDTAASLIAWTMWLLSQHPEEHQKVREEVLRELGDWTSSWKESKLATNSKHEGGKIQQTPTLDVMSSPSYEAIQKCVYLDAVLKEALRLYPPAGTVRYSKTDPGISCGGYHLGPGIYIISHYLMHRHPDNFDKPNDFIPSRFLDDKSSSKCAKNWMPFSDGRRDCIGKHFAMLESKIALSSIILNFNSEIVDSDECMVMKVVNRPKMGCRVRLTPTTL